MSGRIEMVRQALAKMDGMWGAAASAARDAHNQPWGWDVDGETPEDATEDMYDVLVEIRNALDVEICAHCGSKETPVGDPPATSCIACGEPWTNAEGERRAEELVNAFHAAIEDAHGVIGTRETPEVVRARTALMYALARAHARLEREAAVQREEGGL